jgi:hypothetical protein
MNCLELVVCSVQEIKTVSNGLPKEEPWILAVCLLRESNSVGMTGFFVCGSRSRPSGQMTRHFQPSKPSLFNYKQ